MASTIPLSLLERLRDPTLHVRTGLWLVPPADLADVPNEAARVGIDLADMRHALLAKLPPNAHFVALDTNRVLELLDQVASHPRAGGCALVWNVDLLLARLPVAGRADVWSFILNGFSHRRSGLLLAMPATAHALLPTTTAIENWRRTARVYPLPEFYT